MNKQELKNICDSASSKLIDELYFQADFTKLIPKYSSDGKILNQADLIMLVLDQSRNYSEKFIYDVLCQVLNVTD